jgi:hypothetical protein
MKTTPIAEYLARKTVEAPRAPPSALNPRRAVAVNDDQEPEFRRSGLNAALARRAPERLPLVRPIQGELPRREMPSPRPPTPPPPPPPREDIEAKLSEAYHRGVQEGIDSAKAEAATARALERADTQKRAVVEKLDFQMNEYAKLSETLGNGFNELERRLAQAAAQILQPLLERELARRIVDELGENVGRLARGSGVALLKARGPEALLSMLKSRVATLAVEIEYVEDEGVEIVVSSPMTEIRSELGPWRQLIQDIVENG